MGRFSGEADQREDISEVVCDILSRHRDGGLSDPRGRSALNAFITSLTPDDFLSDADMTAFDVYLDITLQVSKRALSSDDQIVADRIRTIEGIAFGDLRARNRVRELIN